MGLGLDDPKDLHITTHLIAATSTTAQLLHNVEEVNHKMTFPGSILFTTKCPFVDWS